jgi:hypothetical protein
VTFTNYELEDVRYGIAISHRGTMMHFAAAKQFQNCIEERLTRIAAEALALLRRPLGRYQALLGGCNEGMIGRYTDWPERLGRSH